jgi:threonine dehydratase
MQKLIRQILTSKVYEAAVETPLEEAGGLSRQLNNRILLKREDLQPIFSFKLRGAYNRIAHLSKVQKKNGVIAASAGNHAQGVAFSARQLGLEAMIVMPATTPQIKLQAVQALGAEVVLHGDNYSEAADRCTQLAEATGMTYIHPFDDELVIAGQGTVADELLRQSAGQLDAVFVPVGGGGLIAGMACYLKELCPEVNVIGVEPVDSDAMYQSIKAGRRVRWIRWGSSPTGWRCAPSAGSLSRSAADMSTGSSGSPPTSCAARSKRFTRRPAPLSNRPVRWPWPG